MTRIREEEDSPRMVEEITEEKRKKEK